MTMRLNTSRPTVVTAQKVVQIGPVIGAGDGRARHFVAHLADHVDRPVGDDHAREDRGEHPEHHDAKADHADQAVEQFAIEAQLALEGDRHGEKHDQRDPDRQELPRHGADDPLVHRVGLYKAADDEHHAAGEEQEHRVFHRHKGVIDRGAADGQRVVGVDLHLARAQPGKGEGEVRQHADGKNHHRRQHQGVQDGAERASPGQKVHGHSPL
ncbi:hypothetical protein [Roseicyclus elongatus]|uniref:hypothetical protein n=1 Tax=Roseicyclus elongatus TaxID=159346 RepID=UPI00387E0666